MTPYQVVWKGPVRRVSGLGIASRAYVRALKRQGVHVTLGDSSGRSPGKSKRTRVLIYHHTPSTINIKKERKLFDVIIMNTVWETTRIPVRWRAPLNQADAVCVPSRQNKRAMRTSGVKVPIYIVPHGVNSRAFSPNNRKLPVKEAKGKFVFVSVFGFQHRKNPEALLKAYWEEFSAADNVLLIIKTSGYAKFENEKWIRNRIQSYKKRLGIRKRTAPVLIMARYFNARKLKGIYTRGHAFVLPTRGEGVGLPFLEAMASGTPAIATGWGGHMDFLTSRNAFLIRYTLRPPAVSMKRSIARQFRNLFAHKGQLWAEADIGSLKRQMRKAYGNPRMCAKKGRQGRRDARNLSWDRAGRSLKKAVEKVMGTRRKR